jgi:hypothetical protein
MWWWCISDVLSICLTVSNSLTDVNPANICLPAEAGGGGGGGGRRLPLQGVLVGQKLRVPAIILPTFFLPAEAGGGGGGGGGRGG